MSDHYCGVCTGPTAKCVACGHFHCDDETCPAFPVECAETVQTLNEEE